MEREESFEDRLNRWTLPELLIELTKTDIYGERKLRRINTRIAELRHGANQDPVALTPEADEVAGLLHPAIVDSSYRQLQNGHLRDAVLNAITAVYDLIRARTGSQSDGDRLIGEVFSLTDPKLILSEIESESGRNDQKGFMQIFKGAYQGIRNPKAHTLTHDLTKTKALQYLVFASLLARRIEEAHSTNE